eukprot:7799095-Pyramimonas_sp.AAC.1
MKPACGGRSLTILSRIEEGLVAAELFSTMAAAGTVVAVSVSGRRLPCAEPIVSQNMSWLWFEEEVGPGCEVSPGRHNPGFQKPKTARSIDDAVGPALSYGQGTVKQEQAAPIDKSEEVNSLEKAHRALPPRQ